MKDADSSKDVGHFACTALGRNRYKIWAIAIIILLACWSVLSGSAWIARKWSAGYPVSYNSLTEQQEEDVDVLEMEIREKLISHMWDKYRHNNRLKLSSFWQDAFEAAYEELESENPAVRQTAITEIARLSVHVFDMDPITHKPIYDKFQHQPHQN